MIRATTPTHTFVFSIDPDNFKTILITYSQGGVTVLEKGKDDLTFEQDGESWFASYRLTQEETKKFKARANAFANVQVRVLTYADEAMASDIMTVSVRDVLNDEVLT